MNSYEQADQLAQPLRQKTNFVNTVWCTPIVSVIILLLLLVTWVPNTFKIIGIAIVTIAHLLQYTYTFIRWQREEKNENIIHLNKNRGA